MGKSEGIISSKESDDYMALQVKVSFSVIDIIKEGNVIFVW